jgi:multidrug efflux pump
MHLAESFVRRPVATIMMNAALVVFGILGLARLPVRELPDIDPSVVSVRTVYPGANAEVVETEITELLEEALGSADSIKLITSQSREQVSNITIEFTQGRDVDLAAQDVRDLVARVRGQLPDDIDEPIIAKQDSGAQPIMWVAFFSDKHSVEELSEIADQKVKDRLQTVPGVSSVILGGEKKRAIRIRLDAQRMAARGVTVLDVAGALQRENLELPSGRLENLDRELTVRTLGEMKTPAEFNRLVIRSGADGVVRLGDIGVAEMGVEDERSIARFTGKPSIGLGVVRQSKSNTLSVAAGIKARMAEIAASLPDGVQFEFPYDESVYVGAAVREVWTTLGIAFVLVVLTIFLFLRSVRSTFVPALAIPVSILATFGVLYVLGLTINIFTLLALVLAIGLVVDDAIVVLENIHRHIEEGAAPFDAAITAIKEISFAVIATTLSLVAVFLPLAFIGGITGRLLLEFAISLSAAVIISTVVALSLSPMAAARILKPVGTTKHGGVYNYLEVKFNNLNTRYERGLGWSLHHRWVIVLIALLSLGLAGYFYINLDQEFLPEEDKGRLVTLAITPVGSSPEYTGRMIEKVEGILNDEPAVESYFAAVALPFEGPGDPTFGLAFVRLKDKGRPSARDIVDGPHGLFARLITEVEGAISIPIMPKAVETGFGQPFELVIKHPDLNALDAYVQQLTGRFMQEGFLSSPRSAFEMNKPEVTVTIDRDRAAELGVSVFDISRTLQIFLGGEDVSSIKLAGKQYEVIAQLNREQRMTPDEIGSMYVRNQRGDLVQLGNLVDVSERAGPTEIQRHGRERSATLGATPAGIPLGEAMKKTEAILAETLPEGFSYTWKGEAKDLVESSGDIYGFMILAIIVVYMVLAAQFESFFSPFVVMLALPLALVGAFGLLYALSWVNHFGTNFYGWAHYAPDPPAIAGILSAIVPRIPSMNMNIFSQVGLILLIGMVTKNSILLVEFANQHRAKGFTAAEAMLKAGLIRLRPILMTSMATIAGLLPIAIGFGTGAESRRPLGVVAVGGMITSTLLTLFVIPVMYTLLADLTKRRRPRKGQTT